MDFNELDLNELDRNLSPEERAEWQAIYASYRSRSVIEGEVSGVDVYDLGVIAREETPRKVRCLIVINYRTKVIIPEHEVFLEDFDAGYHVLHSMCGAKVNYIITHIDREAGFAVASRKYALKRIRDAFNWRVREGETVDVEILSVGRNVCTVTYSGYDVLLPQKEVSYSVVPDLRDIIHPGETKKALITGFDAGNGVLQLSIKDTMPHPFDGIETRHKIGSIRVATIIGKYGGGVFCRLRDNVTDVLCSYESMHYDGDFKIGDRVEILINKYNNEKRLVYGKIIRKTN